MAIKNRRYPKKLLIHHSDKGIQYCCDQYQEELLQHGLKCSMTQGYDPYSNAIAERVNGIIKHEFNLEAHDTPLDVTQLIVSESINIYNQERPHLSCNFLTPNQMHKQQAVKIKTYKTKTGSRFEPASG